MRISDKTVKRIVGFAAVSIVVWSAAFITDYHRCGRLEEPVFAVKTDESDRYKGLGYQVEVERDGDGEILSVTMIMFGKVISASIT